MDYSKTAAAILAGIGGPTNVRSVVHCATRLRFVLADESKADDSTVGAVPGVITVARAGGQYQVVIGDAVPDVFAALGDLGHPTRPAAQAGDEAEARPSLLNRFIAMISAVFAPLIWTLAGTGLLKAFLAAAVTFSWMDATTTTYVVLNALSDAFLFFLPLALAFTAARHMRANEFTSFAIAAALVYPALTPLIGAPDLDFIGIPFTMVSYVSSVIPILVIVWIQSHLERFLMRVLPALIRRFVTPMIVVALAVPFVLLAVGPLSTLISGWIGAGIGWVLATVPWLAGAIMGGLWQVFVIFGLHWGLTPLFTLEYQTTGEVHLMAPLFVAVLAQAAAVAGVLVRSRDRRIRALAAPATVSAFVAGITEPAIYGVNLPLKRPFAFGIVGGAVGGAIVSLGGVYSTAITNPAPLALPALFGHGNMVMLGIGIAAAVVLPFVLTIVVGFREPSQEPEGTTSMSNDVTVLSPLDGTAIALSEISDAVFAAGGLGAGVAIRPRTGAVYAPFDGVVAAAFPTGHAIGLRHADGAEVLIHVGVDTVRLGGSHFTVKVTTGQEVRAGDLLIEFDAEAIAAEGYDLTTAVVVSNADLYPTITDAASGPIEAGDPLLVAVAIDSARVTA